MKTFLLKPNIKLEGKVKNFRQEIYHHCSSDLSKEKCGRASGFDEGGLAEQPPESKFSIW